MANELFYKEGDPLPYRILNIEIQRSISDDMGSMTADIDKDAAPTPLNQLLVKQKDHNGIMQNIFHGIIPTYDQIYESGANEIKIQAYSMEWFLSHQYPDFKNLQTMTWTKNKGATSAPYEITYFENPSNYLKRLFYTSSYLAPGGTVAPWTGWSINTASPLCGSGLVLYNHTIPDVANWLLPGDTGFTNTSTIQKQFVFDGNHTKLDIIRMVADYGKMVWNTKITADYVTTLYMTNGDDASMTPTALGYPADATITAASNQVLDPVRKKVDYNLKYNRVSLAMVDKVNGAWYYGYYPVSPPTPPIIEYRIQSSDLNNGKTTALDPTYPTLKTNGQAIVNAKVQELSTFFTNPTTNYTINLKGRFDLGLYQKVTFTGFTTLPSSAMRIARIERHIGDDYYVTIECTDNTMWAKQRQLTRLYGSDFAKQQQATKDKFFVNLTKIAVGTVQSIDTASGTCIVKLEKGDYDEWGESLVRARLLNQ
jgi:hypothetical protein